MTYFVTYLMYDPQNAYLDERKSLKTLTDLAIYQHRCSLLSPNLLRLRHNIVQAQSCVSHTSRKCRRDTTSTSAQRQFSCTDMCTLSYDGSALLERVSTCNSLSILTANISFKPYHIVIGKSVLNYAAGREQIIKFQFQLDSNAQRLIQTTPLLIIIHMRRS